MKGRGREVEHPLGASEAGLAEGPVRESLQNPQIVPGEDCLARFPIPEGRGRGQGRDQGPARKPDSRNRQNAWLPSRPTPTQREGKPARAGSASHYSCGPIKVLW